MEWPQNQANWHAAVTANSNLVPAITTEARPPSRSSLRRRRHCFQHGLLTGQGAWSFAAPGRTWRGHRRDRYSSGLFALFKKLMGEVHRTFSADGLHFCIVRIVFPTSTISAIINTRLSIYFR